MATYVVLAVPAGRWSATPATSRIRSASTDSPTRFATPSSWPSLDAALEQYESTRDGLSIRRFDVVDRIASHEWDSEEMAALQLQLSSAMANEVEVLAALDPSPAV